MKNQQPVSFRELLEILRPGYRPALTRKDLMSLLISRSRRSILADYTNGLSLRSIAEVEKLSESPEANKSMLDNFWRRFESSQDEVEKMVFSMAEKAFAQLKKDGIGNGGAVALKSEYDTWRTSETSRRRTEAAMAKAARQKEKSAGPRSQKKKKMAPVKISLITGDSAKIALDEMSAERWNREM